MRKNYFDKNYFEDTNFERGSVDTYFNELLLNFILKKYKKGRLLEVGCSYGFFLRKAEIFFDTLGVDISDYAIKQAKGNTKHTKLFNLNIENKEIFKIKEINDSKFDVIVCIDVLEHLSNPVKVLNYFYDHLNNGGCLITRFPNKSSIFLKFYKIMGEKEKWGGYYDKSHISLYDLKKWKKIFKDAGFEHKLLASVPFRFLKKRLYNTPLYFIPAAFIFLNEAALSVCYKS